MHGLINSKDENFLGITVSIELGISPIPTIIKNYRIFHMKSIHLKIKELL